MRCERRRLLTRDQEASYLSYPATELDANQFAAASLMPRHMIPAHRKEVGEDEHALSKQFGVSAEAMRRRVWYLDRLAAAG
jgi:Zn-dependent peptidase ImmA (M78 family)